MLIFNRKVVDFGDVGLLQSVQKLGVGGGGGGRIHEVALRHARDLLVHGCIVLILVYLLVARYGGRLIDSILGN